MRVLVAHLLILLTCFMSGGALAQESTSLALSPPPSGKVRADEMMISVSLNGPLVEALDLAQARLFVDGKDVTYSCLRTERFLSFRPLSPPPAGPVSARLVFPSGVEREWAFEVEIPQLIRSISHDGEGSLGEFEVLTVTMQAETGHKAGFLLGDEEKEFELEETSPGVYTGRYEVQPRDYYLGEPVTGVVHVGSRTETQRAKKPVTLFGHLFRVVIYSPVSGSKISNNFDIKGRTRPNCKVTFVPDLSFQRNTRAPSTQGRGTDGSFETWADDKGFFTANYGVPISLPNLSVVMSVFATTPKGERSVPMVLRYHF